MPSLILHLITLEGFNLLYVDAILSSTKGHALNCSLVENISDAIVIREGAWLSTLGGTLLVRKKKRKNKTPQNGGLQ